MKAIRTGAAILAWTTVSSGHGADLHVPAMYLTVQAAIAEAAPHDRILVAPGVHASPIGTVTKPLTIEGVGGALGCILDGGSASSVPPGMTADVGKGVLTLRGVTVRSGRAWTVASGVFRVERCRFVENGRDSDAGGALAVLSGATLQVVESVFERNRSCCGGAIYCHYAPARLEASGCVFLDNASPFEGGAIHFTSSNSALSGCLFGGNAAPLGGALLRWNGYALIEAQDCKFSLNSSDWNCCVNCTGCATFDRDALLDDCDQDGVGDGLAMLLEPWRDADHSGRLDACECRGDLVGDGVVNAADMAIVLNFWGTNGSQFPGVDIDGDGVVNGSDLAAVLNAWGPCPQ